MVEGQLGRDRLVKDGGKDRNGSPLFVTRRSSEAFNRYGLEKIAAETPERLSPNVLLRPVIEAALFPTLAYVGGPGEMEYLPRPHRCLRAWALRRRPTCRAGPGSSSRRAWRRS